MFAVIYTWHCVRFLIRNRKLEVWNLESGKRWDSTATGVQIHIQCRSSWSRARVATDAHCHAREDRAPALQWRWRRCRTSFGRQSSKNKATLVCGIFSTLFHDFSIPSRCWRAWVTTRQTLIQLQSLFPIVETWWKEEEMGQHQRDRITCTLYMYMYICIVRPNLFHLHRHQLILNSVEMQGFWKQSRDNDHNG